MADHSTSAALSAQYSTGSHITDTRHVTGTPATMTWADLGDGLAARWIASLQKLQGLMEVVWGARPAQYVDPVSGDPSFVDWPIAANPRCLWPEQINYVWCDKDPGDGRTPVNSAYLAAGTSYFGFTAPAVPIRSRSGDPLAQQLDGRTRDTEHFPVGSVTRYAGAEVNDPRGHGWFGGDPLHVGHADPQVYSWETEIAGESVLIVYTPPDGKAVVSATLHYLSTSSAMTDDSGVWKATIPAQEHNTTVRWYVAVVFEGGDDPDYTRYDPGGASAPDTDDKYSYVAFSHWNPWPNGFPEMRSEYRKGTDYYQFDSSETIQPALINLVRYACERLGELTQHDPTVRPELPACCLDMPVIPRWSGSAPWPLYVAGGKAVDGEPLHNMSEAAGSASARSSWRGAGQWFSGNPEYGMGESWKTTPHVLTTDASSVTGLTRNYYKPTLIGLQPGDVIDAVHIVEICEFIDWLIDNGIWRLTPVKRRLYRHPDCGYQWEGEGGTYGWYCSACYQWVDDACVEWDDIKARDGHTQWEDCWNDYETDPDDKPPFGPSTVTKWGWKKCDFEFGLPYSTTEMGGTFCSADNPLGESCTDTRCEGYQGGGRVWVEEFGPDRDWYQKTCEWVTCKWAAWICGPMQNPGNALATIRGTDDLHGNGIVKVRPEVDGGCDEYGNVDYPPSAGNRFVEAWTCAHRSDNASAHDVTFETVGVYFFESGAADWEEECAIDCDSADAECLGDSFASQVSGFSSHRYWDGWPTALDVPGAYWCTFDCHDDTYGLSVLADCGFTLAGVDACMEDFVYARIDLNEDLNGIPTLDDYDDDPGSAYYPDPEEGLASMVVACPS